MKQHLNSPMRALTSSVFGHVLSALFVVSLAASPTSAAALPEGFIERMVAGGLSGVTAMSFAPDGRLFICRQDGSLHVVKNGELLAEPFATFEVDPLGERGLLGVAFDPDFSTNGFVYVYYTALSTPRHNRIVRVTSEDDRAVPGSETLIFRLDDLGQSPIHNGGAMHFGPDGKLYVAVGENGVASNAQSLSNLHGKMLRINRDGSIPSDNPFFNQTTGDRRAIWAMGLRNPFTFAFQPGASRLFINDVGEQSWEEINEGEAGANYGWPESEGPTTNPAHRSPIYAYRHGTGGASACAVTGGAFYNPQASQFPAGFVGKYFFADFCGSWIRTLDTATGAVSDFATGAGSPVDLKVGPDGSLYYLSRGARAVFQIVYAGIGSKPVITSDPVSLTLMAGSSAAFSVAAIGAQPLAYQWQRDGVNIAGANAHTLTLASVTLADDGARFRCVVSNGMGEATSAEAVLRVTPNCPPTAVITAPLEGSLYSAGETVSYAGVGSDPDEGNLAASAFTWRVDFHHEDHHHPFLPSTTGASAGSFIVPTLGETSHDVWYRIHLSVRDAGGLTHETFRDVRPRLSRVTLKTEPVDMQLTLDGRAISSGHTFTGVVGILRSISAPLRQRHDGVEYEFRGWSDGGSAAREYVTPNEDTTLTATYAPGQQAASHIAFAAAEYRVSENARQVALTVTRTGDTTRDETIEYATHDGSATDRSDYTIALGRLDFGPGETTRSIVVLITDGAEVEGEESFTVTLSNPGGGATLGSPSVAAVIIEDDDTGPPTVNPIEDARFFVHRHYHDFLNREPDESGFNFWTDVINQCESFPASERQGCREVRRVHVSAAFFLSLEFQETGFLVHQLSRAAFARMPRLRDFMRDTQALSRGVVVGEDDWNARLEANQAAFLADYVKRAEFRQEFPEALSPAEYVERLASNAALSPEKKRELIERMVIEGATRSEVLLAVAQDLDLRAAEFNRAFVQMQYFGYLRRNPDDQPDADFSGHQFWLDQLNRHDGNYITAELVKAFITSIEYRRRFAP